MNEINFVIVKKEIRSEIDKNVENTEYVNTKLKFSTKRTTCYYFLK